MSDLLLATPASLRAAKGFAVKMPVEPDGRVSVYEPPEELGTYVIGCDFAYGLEGRDWDTGIILRKDKHERVRQVGTLKGHWGEAYHRVLYAAARHWHDAFILGERQLGLYTLQVLWREYGYTRMYYERVQERPGKPRTLRLGHPRVADDVTMRNLRRAVMEKRLELVDEELIAQMENLQYRNKTEERSLEREPDERLRMKLRGGGSPDLVMGLCYAWAAISEVVHFDPPKPKYATNTLGHIFGHDELETEGDPPSGASWVGRRR